MRIPHIQVFKIHVEGEIDRKIFKKSIYENRSGNWLCGINRILRVLIRHIYIYIYIYIYIFIFIFIFSRVIVVYCVIMKEVNDMPLKYVIGMLLGVFFGIWILSICFKGETKKQTQKKNVRRQSTKSTTSTKEKLDSPNSKEDTVVTRRTRLSTKQKTPSRKVTSETTPSKEVKAKQTSYNAAPARRTTRNSSKTSNEKPAETPTGKKRVTRSSSKRS